MKEIILDLCTYHGVTCKDYIAFVDDIKREIDKRNAPVLESLRNAKNCCLMENGADYCKTCGLEFDELIEKMK